ncbi:hypothetical protein Pcinc_044139 [Petrolisthes cinctipes]|uniref:Uncharacterized protein n=1 Tax=Petrolisthes cinctipes TaxID=88211 RepID=A0AAE1BER7_PETCI|nr:hypothetical protein Pcinc_044139 [Petrolisthes cinctipes]
MKGRDNEKKRRRESREETWIDRGKGETKDGRNGGGYEGWMEGRVRQEVEGRVRQEVEGMEEGTRSGWRGQETRGGGWEKE